MAMSKVLQEIADGLDDLIEVQTSPGNGDYCEYMRGMANGLILARTLIDNNAPEYIDAPEFYICDYETIDKLIDQGIILAASEQELAGYESRNAPLAEGK